MRNEADFIHIFCDDEVVNKFAHKKDEWTFRRVPSDKPLLLNVVNAKPNVSVTFNHSLPALVGEFYKIEISLDNHANIPYEISLTSIIQEYSNNLAFLTADGLILPTFNQFSMGTLAAYSSITFEFFVISQVSCDPLVSFELSFSSQYRIKEEIRIAFMDPFLVECTGPRLQIKNLTPINVFIEEYGIMEHKAMSKEAVNLASEKTINICIESEEPFVFYFYWRRNTGNTGNSMRSLYKKPFDTAPAISEITIRRSVIDDGLYGIASQMSFCICNNSEQVKRFMVQCDSPSNIVMCGRKKSLLLLLPKSQHTLLYEIVPLECGFIELPMLQMKETMIDSKDEVKDSLLIQSAKESWFVQPNHVKA